MNRIFKIALICAATYVIGSLAGHAFEPLHGLFMYWAGMTYMALVRNA